METRILFFAGFVVLLVSGCISAPAGHVCVKGECFSVSVADTQAEREKGLMDTESLAGDEGMLFIFDGEGYYAFWMKDTLIPLDMIWIDKGGRIVYIQKDAQPCTADPCAVYGPPAGTHGALFVLEVPGGTAERLGIEAGDEVTLRI